jgi:hypothetical protein
MWPACRFPTVEPSMQKEGKMGMQTIQRAPARIGTGPAGLAYLGAAAFVAAVGWGALAAHGVTVAAAPQPGPGVPVAQGMRAHYQWLATTLPQERLYTSIAILGFLCAAGVAVAARDLLGRDRGPARAGAVLACAGVGLWIAGNVLVLGGHRAVGLMATHINPIQATNSIAFTIDMIGDSFALAAFALIGAGLLALAWAAAQARLMHRAWAGYTAFLAALMLITAWSYAAGNGDLTDAMLLAVGLVLVPAWLVWTGRAAGAGQPRQESLGG